MEGGGGRERGRERGRRDGPVEQKTPPLESDKFIRTPQMFINGRKMVTGPSLTVWNHFIKQVD